ncbi:MAG: hypothetical protein KDC44_02940 [Phaeodactylibacter sp.]|nr:hypothetical protein [Phaeodactylibacter sp.]
MKFYLTLLLALLASAACFAAPKSVMVSNASDTTLKVCIYMSSSIDNIGIATGEFQVLQAGQSVDFDYKFTDGYFIHSVVFLKNNDKLIVHSHQASKTDDKKININLTRPHPKPINRPEIDRMKRLVQEEVNNFGKTYKHVVTIDGDANAGVQEYLGAIVIIDTAAADTRSAIKLMYTARQLNISENPPLSGRSFQESYNISKEFAGEAAVSIPAAFASNINFSNGDLQEITLSCKTIGTVLLPTRPGVTPVGVLLDFDKKSVENIIGTVVEMLDNCESCILQQVQGVLAHSGIAVNVKRYRKSNVAVASSGTSVVTAGGTYQYERGFDYFDIIAPKVIALGFSDINLRTSFSQTVLTNLISQKKDLENKINNQQLSINIMRAELKELEELIEKLEAFAR